MCKTLLFSVALLLSPACFPADSGSLGRTDVRGILKDVFLDPTNPQYLFFCLQSSNESYYTTFKTTVKDGTPEISIAALENGKAHTVTCDVENTGSTAGHATVQLYIQGVSSTIVRRVRELKAFEKVWLKSGETREVTFTLGGDAFSYYDVTRGGWTIDRCRYAIEAGSNTTAIHQHKEINMK